MTDRHSKITHDEIDWSKAKVSRKPCPTCGVDILEYYAIEQKIKKLEKTIELLKEKNRDTCPI